MKIWKNTGDVIKAIQYNYPMLSHTRMVVENDKIYFLYYDNSEIKYIYALEDYWLNPNYEQHPEKEGEYPIVQDAHFNPDYVGFKTKGMTISEIIKKFEENKKKYNTFS